MSESQLLLDFTFKSTVYLWLMIGSVAVVLFAVGCVFLRRFKPPHGAGDGEGRE